jgi:hypothetical protein
MPTPRQTQALNLYRGIMEEVRVRIAAIDSGTGGYLVTLPPPIVREHCFLQLRMICELIAFGCLVAHGEIKEVQQSKFQKQWAADKIMEELEKLHVSFYPDPRKIVKTSRGLHLDEIKPSPCPKEQLLKIYHECGDVLHRGSLRKLISQTTNPQVIHYPRITATAQKVVNLLQSHIMITRDAHLVFLCVWMPDSPYSVSVALAEPPTALPPISLGPPLDRDSEQG